MKNKIFKYIKVFVSVVLVLGLVAPSYASLSASDGSAFVTKAEFDSALADFNSRLTTFEAGINSKIDSQVTSYLDRNGIWNGKQQLIDGSLIEKSVFNKLLFSQTQFGSIYKRMTPYTNTDKKNKVGHLEETMTMVPLFICDKSGLLCFDLRGVGEFNVQMYGPRAADVGWHYMNIDDSFVSFILVADEVIKYVNVISDTELSFESSGFSRRMMNIRPVTIQGFFFVSKGEPLVAKTTYTYYNEWKEDYSDFSGVNRYDFDLLVGNFRIY